MRKDFSSEYTRICVFIERINIFNNIDFLFEII